MYFNSSLFPNSIFKVGCLYFSLLVSRNHGKSLSADSPIVINQQLLEALFVTLRIILTLLEAYWQQEVVHSLCQVLFALFLAYQSNS